MASTTTASNPASPASGGAPENMDGEYWVNRWKDGQTQWRQNERSKDPFLRNAQALMRCLCDVGGAEADGVTPGAAGDGADDDPAVPEAALRQFFAGRTVFVPLCGDTIVLGFWAKRLGCRVVGVDIAEGALRDAHTEQFADRELVETPADARGLKRFDLLPVATGEGAVTLFAGDAFAFMEHWREYMPGVDLVYDRASMVALHPAKQRPRYVELMQRIVTPAADETLEVGHAWFGGRDGQPALRRHRVLFLITIERPEETRDVSHGSPYHIGTNEVFGTFAAADDHVTRFVVPAGDERHLMDQPGDGTNMPPFAECCYVVIARRS